MSSPRPAIAVTWRNGLLFLPIKATPNAGQNALTAYQAGEMAIGVKVTVSPEDGKANEAILKLLASVLKMPKGKLTVHSGQKSRHKQVTVRCDSPDEAEVLLQKLAIALQQPESASCFELRVREVGRKPHHSS